MRWITNLTNKEIGDEIERLCKMADLQLPELPKETAEFLRDEFGRYESKVLRAALDQWIGGRIKVTAYAKANAAFLSKVLRLYIEEHRQSLYFKPKEYIQKPNKPKTADEIETEKRKSYNHLKELWYTQIVDNPLPKQYIGGILFEIQYEYLQSKDVWQKTTVTIEERDKAVNEYMEYRIKVEKYLASTQKSVGKVIASTPIEFDRHKVGMVGAFFNKTKQQ